GPNDRAGDADDLGDAGCPRPIRLSCHMSHVPRRQVGCDPSSDGDHAEVEHKGGEQQQQTQRRGEIRLLTDDDERDAAGNRGPADESAALGDCERGGGCRVRQTVHAESSFHHLRTSVHRRSTFAPAGCAMPAAGRIAPGASAAMARRRRPTTMSQLSAPTKYARQAGKARTKTAPTCKTVVLTGPLLRCGHSHWRYDSQEIARELQ